MKRRFLEAGRSAASSNIARLVSRGPNIDEVDTEGNTPLIIAARNGHNAVVKKLLRARAQVDHTNQKGLTALTEAACKGHSAVVQQLLRAHAQVDHADENGEPALIWAAWKGHSEVVQKLLQAHALVDYANHNGFTALMWAAWEGHSEVVRQLLQAGAQVNYASKAGSTALMLAAKHGHSTVVQPLLQAGSQLEDADEQGDTALLWAAYNGHSAVVQQLLQAGAQVDHANQNGNTALIEAAWMGRGAAVQHLLQADAHVNYANKEGRTALTFAAEHGHSVVVQQLLQARTLVNHADKYGNTALMLAARCGDSGVINELLEYGASVDQRNRAGCTALVFAVKEGHEQIVRRLALAGADPRAMNDAGECAFSLLPETSQLASELRVVQSQARALNALEQLWIQCASSVPTQNELRAALKSDHITSFSAFIIAHNLLLLAVRQRVIGRQEMRYFGGTRDYILEQVYLPVTKLDLTQEQKYLVAKVLSYAETLGFIRDGHATFVKVVSDLRSEIRKNNLQLQTAIVNVARKINIIDRSVGALEKWTEQATEEFRKSCLGQQQILKDMQRMSASLNELHSLLRKHQRNTTIAAVLGFCLSMIPLVGGAIAGAAVASCELAFEIAADTVSSLAATGVSELLSVDLSSFRSVGMLTSNGFLSKLDPVVQKRVETVVKHSKFQTVSHLQDEVNMMIIELEMNDMEISAMDREVAELRQRFNVLAAPSDLKTVSAQEAIEELQYTMERRLNFKVQADDVVNAVIQHMDNTGRISFDAFWSVFSDVKKKCPSPQVHKIPAELGERFRSATSGSQLLKIIAKQVLHALFQESGGEGCSIGNGVSFRRSKEDWDESEVDTLLTERSVSERMIGEEGFIEVGMKVLFGD